MPIYEFYCSDCNVLFNFFTPVVETERRPACPRCARPDLEKRPARFATLGTRPDEPDSGLEGVDAVALEKAFGAMAAELEAQGESEDPRVMAKMLRRAGDASGLEAGPKLEELLVRLESGESVDEVESDLPADDTDDDFADYFRLKRLSTSPAATPARDDEIYFF